MREAEGAMHKRGKRNEGSDCGGMREARGDGGGKRKVRHELVSFYIPSDCHNGPNFWKLVLKWQRVTIFPKIVTNM